MQPNYKRTKLACYAAIITQAVQNNLPPLLFVLFQEQFGISYEMLGRLILANFVTQICVDLVSIKLADRIGYRACMIAGQLCTAVGLLGLTTLPFLLPPYVGLTISIILAAIGGGMTEVLVSPVVDALPGDEKAAAMSMLHSFYCWGQVATVLISTLLLFALGDAAWRVLPLLWMVMPIASVVLIATAPFAAESGAESGGMRVRDLLRQPLFLVAMVIMTCAGASELTMSQWASTFAERGLHVTKVLGDLLGPCLFAVFMGLGRMLYGKLGSRLPLKKSLMGCAILCIVCYLTAALSPAPFLALMGCAVCGFSVSLMWPGSLSMAAARFPFGGTALFAILAVMGDLGCSVGPWLAGAVSDAAQGVPALAEFAAQSGLTLEQLGLKSGLLPGVIFSAIREPAALRPRRLQGGGDFFACGAPDFQIDRESRAVARGRGLRRGAERPCAGAVGRDLPRDSRTRCPLPRHLRGGRRFSLAARRISGSIGRAGPWLAGAVSGAAQGGLALEQLGLKSGLLPGVIFPVILLIGTAFVQEPRYVRKD